MQSTVESMSIWSLVADASPVVQAVMLALLLASLASWYLIVRRSALLRRHEVEAVRFRQQFRAPGDLAQLFRDGSDGAPLQGIFRTGFREYGQLKQVAGALPSNWTESVERMLQVAIAEQEQRLERGLTALATIGSVSPYVGLFGTVWGIMNAFIGLSQVEQATLSTVAPGIAEALIATAIGLFAAIPAVVAYNRFAARCQRLLADYFSFGNELVARLQRHQHAALPVAEAA